MSLSEKAGQLGVFSRPAGSDFNPGTGGGWNATLELLRNGSIGALYNGAGVAINKELQRVAVEESRLVSPSFLEPTYVMGCGQFFRCPLARLSLGSQHWPSPLRVPRQSRRPLLVYSGHTAQWWTLHVGHRSPPHSNSERFLPRVRTGCSRVLCLRVTCDWVDDAVSVGDQRWGRVAEGAGGVPIRQL